MLSSLLLQKPVLKVTTATQTGEAVDEVLRNNDSTLIRLLVTGQDLTNGYKLCPNGQVNERSVVVVGRLAFS